MLVHRCSALAIRSRRFRTMGHTCACPSARRRSSLPNEGSSALHSLQARQHSMKRAASAPAGAPTCSGSGITDAETLVRRNNTLDPRSAALVPGGRRARAPIRLGARGALHAHVDASDTGGRVEITHWETRTQHVIAYPMPLWRNAAQADSVTKTASASIAIALSLCRMPLCLTAHQELLRATRPKRGNDKRGANPHRRTGSR